MRAFIRGPLALVLALVACLALVAGAFLAVRMRAPSRVEEGARRGGAPLPDLRAKADAIDRIEIERGGRKAVLVRSPNAGDAGNAGNAGNAWIAVDKADLPIEADRVRDLVRGLARLEIEQAMTSSKDRHAELELDWPSANATLIRLFADGSSTPFSELVIGKTRFQPSGVYVRRLTEDQTWRCAGSVAAEPDSIRLMTPTLVALPPDSITSIEALGTPIAISLRRDETGAWKPSSDSAEPLPAPKVAEAARHLPELFTRLEFDDARRVATPPVSAAESIAGHVGDRTVTIELLPMEAPTSAAAPAMPATPATNTDRWYRVVVGPPEPGLSAGAPSEATIATLDAIASRVAGREFRLPAWRAGRLTTLLAPPAATDAPKTAPPVGDVPGG